MALVAGNVGQAVAARFAADPARPVLTWYDDATGDRTELSGATLGNWLAKTANLLVDGCGLGPGDTAAVLLPPHWQTAAVLLGCWSAGLAETDSTADVLFVAADRLSQGEVPPAGDRYALALAPMAAPLRTVPPGFADYVVEVRAYGDHFTAYAGSDGLVEVALSRAQAHGISETDRVLVDAARYEDPLDWLLAPLLAGASIVLCGHLDESRLADRLTAEKVTLQLI